MNNKIQAPDDWEVVRLGEIADVDRGLSWAREQESPVSQDAALPVVRIGNVQPHGFQMDDILYIQGVTEAERSRRSITSRTLVMVGSNGNRDRVGNTFLANEQVIGHLLASFLIGIHPRNDVSERFLFSSLRSAKTQGVITESTAGSTGLKNLSLTWLRNLQVNLPPLPEQRAIAAVLDSIDEAIERTEAVIAATERLRDALLHELLTRGVPGWHSEWKEAPGIGTIPACWEVARLGEVCEVKGGKRLPKGSSFADTDTGLPYIRVVDFRNRTVDSTDIQFLNSDIQQSISRYTISSKDIYISIAGTIGLVGLVPSNLDGANLTENAAKIVIVNARGLSPYFLMSFLDSYAGQTQVSLRVNVLGQPKLALERIRTIVLPIPTFPEQRVIAETLSSIDDAVERASVEMNVLQSVKASAADALLTGTMRARNHNE